MMGQPRSGTTAHRLYALQRVQDPPHVDGRCGPAKRGQRAVSSLRATFLRAPPAACLTEKRSVHPSEILSIPECIAMQDGKSVDHYGRQTETNWIREALKEIECEAPGLLEEATLAMTELAKRRGDGGRMLE